MPLRQIITPLTVFFLSFPLFGQSEENIQFETFYQEKETSNSEIEEFQGSVLFPEKQPGQFQVEDLDSEANKESHFETEASFEKVLNTGTKEKNITVYRSPLLARALFFTSEIGKEISEKLYNAVAGAVAYIYKIDKGEYVDEPQIDIPEDLRFNENGKAMKDKD